MPSDRRAWTSYAKVRHWIGRLLRNRTFQLRSPRIAQLQYLDIGCGPNTHPDFVNLDYLWHPNIDVCWNVSRGLPFADKRFRGVFSEHVLEHFSMSAAELLLRECHRVLAPGGMLRVVVPDGGWYLELYQRHRAGDHSTPFPYQAHESFGGWWTPMLSVNRVFYHDRSSPHGHWVTYDFELLAALLQHCGFVSVTRRRFREGNDVTLLIDTASRAPESLYVEATKP